MKVEKGEGHTRKKKNLKGKAIEEIQGGGWGGEGVRHQEVCPMCSHKKNVYWGKIERNSPPLCVQDETLNSQKLPQLQFADCSFFLELVVTRVAWLAFWQFLFVFCLCWYQNDDWEPWLYYIARFALLIFDVDFDFLRLSNTAFFWKHFGQQRTHLGENLFIQKRIFWKIQRDRSCFLVQESSPILEPRLLVPPLHLQAGGGGKTRPHQRLLHPAPDFRVFFKGCRCPDTGCKMTGDEEVLGEGVQIAEPDATTLACSIIMKAAPTPTVRSSSQGLCTPFALTSRGGGGGAHVGGRWVGLEWGGVGWAGVEPPSFPPPVVAWHVLCPPLHVAGRGKW